MAKISSVRIICEHKNRSNKSSEQSTTMFTNQQVVRGPKKELNIQRLFFRFGERNYVDCLFLQTPLPLRLFAPPCSCLVVSIRYFLQISPHPFPSVCFYPIFDATHQPVGPPFSKRRTRRTRRPHTFNFRELFSCTIIVKSLHQLYLCFSFTYILRVSINTTIRFSYDFLSTPRTRLTNALHFGSFRPLR